MNRPVSRLFGWVFALSFGFLFGSALLRCLLLYFSNRAALTGSLIFLAAWLVFFLVQPWVTRRWPPFFNLYLVIQSFFTFVLIYSNPEPSDFFALLYCILSMQVVLHYQMRIALVCIALFTPLTILPLTQNTSVPVAIVLGLIYLAGNALLASFALATRRAAQAHSANQKARQELLEANQRLKEYSRQLEQLAVARERSRMARELHDSVTQSVFSLTLTAQSALLMAAHEAGPQNAQIEEQLVRMEEYIQGAMSELQLLVTELNPRRDAAGGLAESLRRHLAERHLPEGLTVNLLVSSGGTLSAAEEQALFRVVQESLNNIVKHSGASQAEIELCLSEPAWIEIRDNGCGFAPEAAERKGRMGLAGMRERAVELGWTLQVRSAPGAGTQIRIEKPSTQPLV